jgi:hypothetical protein
MNFLLRKQQLVLLAHEGGTAKEKLKNFERI